MLEVTGNQLNLSIADPNQYEEEIVVTINTKLEIGENIIWNSATGNSEITFKLPQGIYLGKVAQASCLWSNGSKPQSPSEGGARRVGDVNPA